MAEQNNKPTEERVSYLQQGKDYFTKASNKIWTISEKRAKKDISRNGKDIMGIGVSYTLIIVDVFLIAVRMFNKNAAEATMTINNTIWGSLASILESAGDWCARIPVIGKGLDALLTGLSTISDSFLSLLNIVPSVLYNFWEILFWVFIIMTLLKAIPDILGKYAVERRYIAARYDEMLKIKAMEAELKKQKSDTLPELNKNDVLQLECKKQNSDEMINSMEVFDDRRRKESARISEE